MSGLESSETAPEVCGARPLAAQRGFREDMLCASRATTSVLFRGRVMPVCRMHEAMYRRWASNAETNAALAWGWGDVDGDAG